MTKTDDNHFLRHLATNCCFLLLSLTMGTKAYSHHPVHYPPPSNFHPSYQHHGLYGQYPPQQIRHSPAAYGSNNWKLGSLFSQFIPFPSIGQSAGMQGPIGLKIPQYFPPMTLSSQPDDQVSNDISQPATEPASHQSESWQQEENQRPVAAVQSQTEKEKTKPSQEESWLENFYLPIQQKAEQQAQAAYEQMQQQQEQPKNEQNNNQQQEERAEENNFQTEMMQNPENAYQNENSQNQPNSQDHVETQNIYQSMSQQTEPQNFYQAESQNPPPENIYQSISPNSEHQNSYQSISPNSEHQNSYQSISPNSDHENSYPELQNSYQSISPNSDPQNSYQAPSENLQPQQTEHNEPISENSYQPTQENVDSLLPFQPIPDSSESQIFELTAQENVDPSAPQNPQMIQNSPPQEDNDHQPSQQNPLQFHIDPLQEAPIPDPGSWQAEPPQETFSHHHHQGESKSLVLHRNKLAHKKWMKKVGKRPCGQGPKMEFEAPSKDAIIQTAPHYNNARPVGSLRGQNYRHRRRGYRPPFSMWMSSSSRSRPRYPPHHHHNNNNNNNNIYHSDLAMEKTHGYYGKPWSPFNAQDDNNYDGGYQNYQRNRNNFQGKWQPLKRMKERGTISKRFLETWTTMASPISHYYDEPFQSQRRRRKRRQEYFDYHDQQQKMWTFTGQ